MEAKRNYEVPEQEKQKIGVLKVKSLHFTVSGNDIGVPTSTHKNFSPPITLDDAIERVSSFNKPLSTVAMIFENDDMELRFQDGKFDFLETIE